MSEENGFVVMEFDPEAPIPLATMRWQEWARHGQAPHLGVIVLKKGLDSKPEDRAVVASWEPTPSGLAKAFLEAGERFPSAPRLLRDVRTGDGKGLLSEVKGWIAINTK